MKAIDPAALEDVGFWVLPIKEPFRRLRQSPGVVTVVVLSLGVVALGGLWPGVIRALESRTDLLADAQVWRLLTYVFPHEGGWVHVVLNMLVLSAYGPQLELVVGAYRFVVAYFVSGAVGMALLFAFNPIDAERGIRSGASLAVFGVVAATLVIHLVVSGWRSLPVRFAAGTCLMLLVVGGLLGVAGHQGVIEPGWHGFAFGFFNHSLGMLAGAVVGLAYGVRWKWMLAAATLALTVTAAIGLGIGTTRWT